MLYFEALTQSLRAWCGGSGPSCRLYMNPVYETHVCLLMVLRGWFCHQHRPQPYVVSDGWSRRKGTHPFRAVSCCFKGTEHPVWGLIRRVPHAVPFPCKRLTVLIEGLLEGFTRGSGNTLVPCEPQHNTPCHGLADRLLTCACGRVPWVSHQSER